MKKILVVACLLSNIGVLVAAENSQVHENSQRSRSNSITTRGRANSVKGVIAFEEAIERQLTVDTGRTRANSLSPDNGNKTITIEETLLDLKQKVTRSKSFGGLKKIDEAQ